MSYVKPFGLVSLDASPPTLWRASNSLKLRWPSSWSRYPAASPVGPAPTTTIFCCCDIRRVSGEASTTRRRPARGGAGLHARREVLANRVLDRPEWLSPLARQRGVARPRRDQPRLGERDRAHEPRVGARAPRRDAGELGPAERA